ncbi:MAG: CHAT domain-containing protein [Acidobacteria bacterium]|nr:CHAT domain-containing protein [Acidobacteriota bacterium]
MHGALDSITLRQVRQRAMIDCEQGRVTEALAALDALLELNRPLTPVEQIECRLDRSSVYMFANRWLEALADLRIAEELVPCAPIVQQKLTLNVIYHAKVKLFSNPRTELHDPAAADAALATLRTVCSIRWLPEELESDLALKAKNWERCLRASTVALGMFEAEGWKRPAAIMRRRMGEARMEMEQFDLAKMDLSAALEFFTGFGSFDDLSLANLTMARLRSRCAEHEDAWKFALDALDAIESLIRNFRVIGEQQQFVIDKLRYYDEVFAIGFAAGGPVGWKRAWTIAERAKSFYLCHLIANADIPLFEGVDPALMERLRDLETQLDQISKRDDHEQQRLVAQARQQLLFQVMRDNPRWASVHKPVQADISQILRTLPASWSPVSYFWRDSDSGGDLYVFSAGPDREPRCTVVPWSKEDVAALALCRSEFMSNYGPAHPWRLKDLRAKLLPDEVLDKLPPNQALLISPHAHIRGLPIHALDLGDEDYLIKRQAVQYVPTLTLAMLPRQAGKAERILLMGCPETPFNKSPLRGVEKEISELGSVWRERLPESVDDCILPPQGSPEQAGFPLSKWSDYCLLHFSCHGDFPVDRPFDCALMLGSDAVRASELFAVALSESVVVLSACNLGKQASAIGVDSSDEWVGMYLPLFYAGARQLLVSLWEADASTAHSIMVFLHSAISNGVVVADALRGALSAAADGAPEQLWANWYLVGLPQDEE